MEKAIAVVDLLDNASADSYALASAKLCPDVLKKAYPYYPQNLHNFSIILNFPALKQA